MRFVQTALWVIALSLPPTLAGARTGHCLLQVNGKTHLDGSCQITNQHDRGSFSVGAGGPRRSKYFAYVVMENDGAHGYWNETPDSSHAHADLGMLKRHGACWVNERAKICAYQ